VNVRFVDIDGIVDNHNNFNLIIHFSDVTLLFGQWIIFKNFVLAI
jgi:hypothetical protein